METAVHILNYHSTRSVPAFVVTCNVERSASPSKLLAPSAVPGRNPHVCCLCSPSPADAAVQETPGATAQAAHTQAAGYGVPEALSLLSEAPRGVRKAAL